MQVQIADSALPIDHDFDVEFVNRLAKLESYNRHLYRPNTYLHKWWARRNGTTFRAILKHLIPDDNLRDFYTPNGLAGLVILDPMMGGGTTLHEAIRMGANVIGADIDPIPVLQARATLSHVPMAQLEAAFEQFHDAVSAELNPSFTTTCPFCDCVAPMRFMLYGQTRHCACRSYIVADSLTLRQNRDGGHWHIDPQSGAVCLNETVVSQTATNTITDSRLITSTQSHCTDCGQKLKDNSDTPFYQRYVPLAIFGRCATHGKFFRSPSTADLEQRHRPNARDTFDAADFAIPYGPKSQHLHQRGIHNYLDVFTDRQLHFAACALAQLQQMAPVVRLNLALLTSTSLEFNSLLCGYKGWRHYRPGAIKHTFARHAYSIPYTALENNLLYGHKRSGTLHKLFHSRIARARQWAAAPVERDVRQPELGRVALVGERDSGQEVVTVPQHGERQFMLCQGDSAELPLPPASVDHIVTDPPYFDSVQYDDLAAFFRVWLRQFVPDGAVWDYSAEKSAIDPHAKGNGQYTSGLTNIFTECARVLKPQGRLIFTFHHWNPKGWAALTIALQRAGFALINRYVVHAENPRSVHIANQNSLLHDVVFVLGKKITPTQPPPAGEEQLPLLSGGARGGYSYTQKTETTNVTDWATPTKIAKDDSETFCYDCGTLLGHLLATEASELHIRHTWQSLLG